MTGMRSLRGWGVVDGLMNWTGFGPARGHIVLFSFVACLVFLASGLRVWSKPGASLGFSPWRLHLVTLSPLGAAASVSLSVCSESIVDVDSWTTFSIVSSSDVFPVYAMGVIQCIELTLPWIDIHNSHGYIGDKFYMFSGFPQADFQNQSPFDHHAEVTQKVRWVDWVDREFQKLLNVDCKEGEVLLQRHRDKLCRSWCSA
ncbi:hypothetical protein Tco_0250739 [Tanacetum coccineum]